MAVARDEMDVKRPESSKGIPWYPRRRYFNMIDIVDIEER